MCPQVGSRFEQMQSEGMPEAVGSDRLGEAPQLQAAGFTNLRLRNDGQLRQVRPARGTYSLRLRAVDGLVLSSAVDGRTIDTSRYRSPSPQWTLGYVVPPADGFVLTLVVTRGKPLELDVISRTLGLPSAITIPPRPNDVVQIHAGDQTVTHRRVRF
jgi:hypothetical protein